MAKIYYCKCRKCFNDTQKNLIYWKQCNNNNNNNNNIIWIRTSFCAWRGYDKITNDLLAMKYIWGISYIRVFEYQIKSVDQTYPVPFILFVIVWLLNTIFSFIHKFI